MKQAEADWEPRFAEVFTAKEGAPRIVERTIAPCGAMVDVVDAPPKLMAAGLADRAELLQAAYGDPSTRIDVLSSPNLDAAGDRSEERRVGKKALQRWVSYAAQTQ